jgi:hypothetical protein
MMDLDWILNTKNLFLAVFPLHGAPQWPPKTRQDDRHETTSSKSDFFIRARAKIFKSSCQRTLKINNKYEIS